MATIIKSNNYYNGDAILPSIDQMLTAQQAFDKYKSFVEANEGVIMNPTECLSDFQFMKDNKILGKVNAVSVNWGVKKNTSNIIETLFSPDGSEYITTGGTAPIYRTDLYSYPVFKFAAINPGTLVQKNAQKNNYSRTYILACSVKKMSSGGFYHSIGNGVLQNNVDAFFDTPYSTGSVLLSGYLYNSSGVELAVQKSGAYHDGAVAFVDNFGKFGKMFTKGTSGAGFKDVPNMIDTRNAETSKIYINKRLLNGVLTGGGTNDELTEAWLINDATEDIAIALSARLDSRY